MGAGSSHQHWRTGCATCRLEWPRRAASRRRRSTISSVSIVGARARSSRTRIGWSKTDPDSKIAKMKDGSTHLAYKPEHAVDLDTGIIVAATDPCRRRGRHDDARPTVCGGGKESVADYNLGVLMRALFDTGTPREAAAAWNAFVFAVQPLRRSSWSLSPRKLRRSSSPSHPTLPDEIATFSSG